MDVVVDEDLQIFGRVKFLHFQRRDDDMLYASSPHPYEETVVEQSYPQAHHVVSVFLSRVGDESYRMVRRVTGRAEHLGDSYTGSLCAVDHDARTALASLERLIHGLHTYAEGEEHHERHRHVDKQHRVEDRMRADDMVRSQVDQHQDDTCGYIRKEDLDRIDEG